MLRHGGHLWNKVSMVHQTPEQSIPSLCIELIISI